ncbi:hypothetical protein GQ600_7719 [Phytophthora cactorum]|nr:hypothetical protein GQ600_7719 [Phytophthora cactorum]
MAPRRKRKVLRAMRVEEQHDVQVVSQQSPSQCDRVEGQSSGLFGVYGATSRRPDDHYEQHRLSQLYPLDERHACPATSQRQGVHYQQC